MDWWSITTLSESLKDTVTRVSAKSYDFKRANRDFSGSFDASRELTSLEQVLGLITTSSEKHPYPSQLINQVNDVLKCCCTVLKNVEILLDEALLLKGKQLKFDEFDKQQDGIKLLISLGRYISALNIFLAINHLLRLCDVEYDGTVRDYTLKKLGDIAQLESIEKGEKLTHDGDKFLLKDYVNDFSRYVEAYINLSEYEMDKGTGISINSKRWELSQRLGVNPSMAPAVLAADEFAKKDKYNSQLPKAIASDIELEMGNVKYETSILENFRLKHPAKTKSLPPEQSEKIYAKFQCWLDWNPQKFMRQQFGDFETKSIGSVIVLTGTSLRAQATTCAQYLQNYWPDTHLTLLRCLESVKLIGWGVEEGDDLEFLCKVVNGNLNIRARGTSKKVLEITQQLVWLGAALQHSPSGNIKYSEMSADLIRETESFLHYKISPLEDNELSCWHSLFTDTVIAKDFAIAEREQGIGLEIPLEMMAALAGVRHAVEYEGGIILKGHSSAFIPVKRYKDSIQWHYIQNRDNTRLAYNEVAARCPSRAMLKEVSMDCLKSTRSFVGWWDMTKTHLGTETANYENIDWSPSIQASRPIRFSGVALGFQQLMTGEMNFSLGAREGKLHVERKVLMNELLSVQLGLLLFSTIVARRELGLFQPPQ